MSQKNIDVLIVGAGPVGLFCANELNRHGLTCRIIDKKTHISEKSKALGIHIRTLDVLQDSGFIKEILMQGHPVEGITFKSNGKTLIKATFEGIEANRHFLIDLPQNKTEAILSQSLEQKGINIEWETELTDVTQTPTEITATIKKANNKVGLLNANWLIACDGSHSTIRHLMHAEFKGAEYQQAWWLADVLLDWDVSDKHMSIYINKRGPLACFPMGDKRYRLVMTAPEGSMTDPTLEDIACEFKQRSSDAAAFTNPIWLSRFTIHHRQIQKYRYDRVFFAGDAAHIHSPMGGQGLNTGIQDIYNLIWKLALVEKGRAKPELLDSYHEERFPIGHEVLKKTDKMTRMILLTNPLLIVLRNSLIKLVLSIRKIRNFIIRDVAELSISYRKSSIVHHFGDARYLVPGEYVPSFELMDPVTNRLANSITITQGTEHHLFLFAGIKNKKITKLFQIAENIAQKYPSSIKVHLVLRNKTELGETSCNQWIDEQLQLHKRFKLTRPTLILIRPDKYIGFLQKPINEKKWLEQLYLLSP